MTEDDETQQQENLHAADSEKAAIMASKSITAYYLLVVRYYGCNRRHAVAKPWTL